MDRPRFSSALLQRRRELGLSTAQASRVLKLKEQVLIALEEGDFESIPKSGYAQGMVSSYARYLGLDPREMVDLFTEDLEDYEAAQGKRKRGKKQTRSSQYMRIGAPRPAVDDSRRNLLPTSGGRAGDMGDFATTSAATARSASVPLVSAERMRASYDSYGNQIASGYDAYGNDSYPHADYEEDYRAPRAASMRSLRSNGLGSQQGYYSAESLNPGYAGYDDGYYDGYYDDASSSFDDAYAEDYGRSSQRTQSRQRSGSGSRNGSATRRSGTSSRRSGSNARSGSSSRNGSSSQRGRSNVSSRSTRRHSDNGFDGLLSFVSESRVIIGIAALVVTVILVVAIIMGVKSCTKSRTQDDIQGVPVTTTVPSTSTDNSSEVSGEGVSATSVESQEGQVADPTASSDPNQTSASQGESGTEASDPASAAEPSGAQSNGSSEGNGQMISTEVSVSVASGETTWLEVMVDGESRVADTVVGPWNDTYVVKESLTVQADNTAAVSVFENGEVRAFETRASGVGIITIKVPVSALDATADETVDQTDDTSVQY